MNTNNSGTYAPLQRRRRRSDQVSPSSPSQLRRLPDRSYRHSDAFSPATSTPATADDADSPLLNLDLNLTLTSPLFDPLAPMPTNPVVSKTSTADPKHRQRSSEEDGRTRYRSSEEAMRPATSVLAGQHSASSTSVAKPLLTGSDYGSRPSPSMPFPGQSATKMQHVLDPPVKFTGTSNSPSQRNYNFPTTSDRYLQEDSAPIKLQAGKKSRMNLLNPMNLLMRRRSSQIENLDGPNLSIKTLAVPELPDFDPSIRGKVVHDFSAPRTKRFYSNNDIGNLESPLRSAYGLDPGRNNDSPVSLRPPVSGNPTLSHSPMFKEHFQDDRPSLQPERTGYLHNIHTYNVSHTQDGSIEVPAFARRLPSTVPRSGLDADPELTRRENKPLPPEKENVPPSLMGEPSPPPPTPPPKSTPSPKFDFPSAAALPKHMTSTSSRFSFQIGGTGSSTQEKMMEDKHKEHAATKKTSKTGLDPDDDDFDYDPDADDGFEERIPGVNADYEDDGFGDDEVPLGNALEARYGPSDVSLPDLNFEEDDDNGFGDDDIPIGNALEPRHGPPEVLQPSLSENTKPSVQRNSLKGFHFTPQSLTFSPTSTNNGSQPTPRDHEGFAIGIADYRLVSQDEHANSQPKEDIIEVEKISMLGGLGISTAEVPRRRTTSVSRPQGGVFDDEDLYFDDGEFGEVENDPTSAVFDETLFDDETGRIRDIPADNARKLEAAKIAAGPHGEVKAVSTWDEPMGRLSVHDDVEPNATEAKHDRWSDTQPKRQPSLMQQEPSAGLTETNLAAYHDALALATNQAAASGRFDRKVSFDQNSDATSQSPFETSQRGVVSDDSRFSYNYNSAIAEDDGFPFDDELDDDLMIAEANAEALENDDDGFYGQEFGFYARSRSKDNNEFVNGGYFAERGSNGIKRSHSGKANFQEPSLTPITERSEWSTRNSVVSLQIPGGIPASAQSMPSPGIAQLRELDSPSYDEDMTFSALMKLRGRAFGGSSSSISSSAGGYAATSPRVQIGNNSFSYGDLNGSRMAASMHGTSSSIGIPESEEEEEEFDRPTLTQNTPRKKSAEPAVVTSQEEMPSSPLSAGGERRRGHHSRTSSGAESVSYARDTDGGWVLERRRTDEGSGTEVIDREYLGGGRI